jgi:hypothetical protein
MDYKSFLPKHIGQAFSSKDELWSPSYSGKLSFKKLRVLLCWTGWNDHNSGLAVKNGIARRRLQDENRRFPSRNLKVGIQLDDDWKPEGTTMNRGTESKWATIKIICIIFPNLHESMQ